MGRRRSILRELVETAVLTIAIFLVVRVALQNFKVEGESMLPNLHNSEYILVNKIDYMLHSPNRGDVIVFQATPAGSPDKDFIKRVIGVPGDTVEVKTGLGVYVNDKLLKEPYINQIPAYNYPKKVVPPGDYFVLGDNRNNSQDSHLWNWLPRKYIIGKAWVSYWPPSDVHVFNIDIPLPHLPGL